MTADYPESRRDESVAESLHGHQIVDPYRWLEDADAAETKDWVGRQNAFTQSVLAQYAEREWFQQAMTAILRRPRAGVPVQKCGWFFVGRNDGTKAQDVVYVADSLAALLEGGRVLIDPNTLSEGGTDSLGTFTVSPDGRYFAYGINESGSDWTTFRLLEVATGAEVDDVVTEAKFSEATWLPDSSAYLYSHYPASGRSEGTETKVLGGGQLKLHKIGTLQADDQLILSFPDNPRMFVSPTVSDDDRYVVVQLNEGTDAATRLWLYPIGFDGLGEPIKVVDEFADEIGFVRMAGDRLILRTNRDAPRGRLVSSDFDGVFTDVIPEAADTLSSVYATSAGLATLYLVDAQPELRLHDLDGGNARSVPLAGGGLVDVTAGAKYDELFIGLSSSTEPTLSYVVSASGRRHPAAALVGACRAGVRVARDHGDPGCGARP
ncbi:hypothetical protein [Kribbella qitaiheensis]|uniref:hypothetical protein n=1 Tax=Kribbella qitaiheensis TaxID=1544730 RepID=UPI001627E08E|nr:hypothetical protein [Kribbella qitaiheensis]